MNDMVSRYPGKQVMISEFGYDVTQPQTAHDFGVDLINKVKSVPNNNALECFTGSRSVITDGRVMAKGI